MGLVIHINKVKDVRENICKIPRTYGCKSLMKNDSLKPSNNDNDIIAIVFVYNLDTSLLI